MNTIKEIGKVDAQLLADYILQEYSPISHLKLQKLLFYCEAYHLAYFESELLNQQFEAWVHGPVCRDVFNNLKDKSLIYADISFDNCYNPKHKLEGLLTTNQMEVIDDVLQELSGWTALELENATHNEEPWLSARKGYSPSERCTTHISKDEMISFYRRELNG